MRGKRLIWQLYPSFVLIIFTASAVTTGFAGGWRFDPALILICLIAALAGGGLCLLVILPISRTILAMRDQAERITLGDLDSRIPIGETGEIAGLAEAMNLMAGRLDDRIRAVQRQRHEQEAVLASMVEGVIAVDLDERILEFNQSAARLLGTQAGAARGRFIQEAVRNTALQQFVAQALRSSDPIEGELTLRDQGALRHMQVHGAPLRDESGRATGALVVLHDVTRLHRLETVRRDFVANVSHELKTPVTSIKGFTETLLEGALENPEDARKFLSIIARQADRLNAIIEDLLSLSRLEQDEQAREIPMSEGDLREVLWAAFESCARKAGDKGVIIQVACEPGMMLRMNAPLVEQAVINLIDNAVKYSDPGGTVQVEAVRSGEHGAVIRVRDQGPGIGREHLQRLFERFYRVDKARSRKLGGTGLGLAIVKHIAQVQGGSVAVESRLGHGSTFTITLPGRLEHNIHLGDPDDRDQSEVKPDDASTPPTGEGESAEL